MRLITKRKKGNIKKKERRNGTENVTDAACLPGCMAATFVRTVGNYSQLEVDASRASLSSSLIFKPHERRGKSLFSLFNQKKKKNNFFFRTELKLVTRPPPQCAVSHRAGNEYKPRPSTATFGLTFPCQKHGKASFGRRWKNEQLIN